MKVAILSDIHGNKAALEAVLKAANKKNFDVMMIAGDFIGYYFWPSEVFALLEDLDPIAISGNHDQMLRIAKEDAHFLSKMCDKYGSGLRVALESLDKKQVDWLFNLPESLEFKVPDGKILICHGSPWENDEYIYPDVSDKSLDRYKSLDANWVIQGHTHYPMYRKIFNSILINPGSVGQPRNGQPGAHWALLDTQSDKVDFYCEQYDYESVAKEALKRHPELPYLANILKRI